MSYLIPILLALGVALLCPSHSEAAPRGRVAILRDSFPSRPGNADPEVLRSLLERHGYKVQMLRSEEIADPTVLAPSSFDCLVLPYGPSYPYAAYQSIKAYLKGGGSFFSMGGYAFDEPCERNASGEMQPMKWSGEGVAPPACLNTRFGKPADTMGLEPDQIGVFDPSYHLKYSAGFRAAPMQSIIPPSVEGKVALEGYSACSVLGSNSPVFPEKWGRHMPLMDVVDSHSRLRGSAGSMAFNYAGPYAGSSWAFFGVTNTDLFSAGGPLADHLGDVMDALVRKVFLHSAATDMACYREGESVKMTCAAADLGKHDQHVDVTFRVFDGSGKQVFASQPVPLTLKAGDTQTVTAEYGPKSFSSDLYRVAVEMSIGGKLVDTVETGFVAHSLKAMASGLKLNYKDNYFRVGDRPVLLSGTNVTGAIFYSGNENPLIWDRDLARMNENGLNILRVLHFSPFMSDKPSATSVTASGLALDRMPTKIERQLDALVQLCQKHNIALFLSIHDWMPCELSDSELAAQRKFAKLIAERYKDVPGFMIDIQNEPSIELPRQARPNENADVLRAWNDYLRGKYGSDDALKAAWTLSPPEADLGSVPYRAGTDVWDDMRTFDADCFRNTLLKRWAKANYDGAKEGDPDVPVTVGFLQEYFALNKLISVEGLDFANMHSYNPIEILRADLKLFDRRFEGKSLSVGEFGALPDHEKRTHGQDNPDQDIDRYLLTGHYAFGMGASFIASWCWKDMDDVIFPWGMNYTCEGPRKDLLKAYRNQSLLFRRVRPVYKPQSVFLVVPVEAMLGGQYGQTVKMLYRHVDALLDAHVDFGTIDDGHLDQLPASAKMLIYPVPMHVPDRAYAKLKSFVEAGGRLFVTGDISYDGLRRRTKPERLEELCGVRFVAERKRGTDWGGGDEALVDVQPTEAAREGMLFVHRLGKGTVRYTPIPSGMLGEPRGYAFQDPAEKPWDVYHTGTDGVHSLSIREPNGGCLFMVNTSQQARSISSAPPEATPLKLVIEANGTGFERGNESGDWLAIESRGPVTIGDPDYGTSIPARGHFALMYPGEPQTERDEMLVIPFGECEIDLTGIAALKNAVVQTGDVIDGKWVVLSESTDKKIGCTGDTAFDIRIIAPKQRLAALGKWVASELMLR